MTKEQAWAKIQGPLMALITVVISVMLSMAGVNQFYLAPLLAESQAEGRGGSGVTRFTSDVQMQGNLTVDHAVTAESLNVSSQNATALFAPTLGATTFTATLGTLDNLASTYNITATNSISVANDISIADDLTVTDLGTVGRVVATYLTATNVISMAGATFTGAIKYGAASSVVSGTIVSHGMGVTPTVVMLTPIETSGGLTQTVWVITSSATIFTIGVEAGATIDAVNWMAGK